MKLIALRAFPFGPRDLRPGQAFEASGPDGSLLVAVGLARRDETVAEPVADQAASKRKYRRKDLQAE